MAYAPIAYTIPQYDRTNLKNYWLKAYEQGTTTPKAISLDAAGSTTYARVELDTQGFPITSGGARFIPFIDGYYDLWAFPTAAEADANDTTNAIQFADNINADPNSNGVAVYSTVSEMKSKSIATGEVVATQGYYSSGDGGGARYIVVSPQSFDGYGDHELANGNIAVLQYDSSLNVRKFGARADSSTDDNAAITATIAAAVAKGTEVRPSVYLPAGDYAVASPIEIVDDALTIYGDGNAAPFNNLTVYPGCTKITYTGAALTTDTQGVMQFGAPANQCRGIKVSDLTIDAATLGNAIHGEQLNSAVIERVTTLQAEWGVYLKGSNNNSNSFIDCTFYDPNTGGGGMDLRENCHSNDITRCNFSNKSTGTRNPVNAVRIAQTANCSAISIIGSNFDYYRTSDSLVELVNDCKSFGFINNYMECRDDGVTGGAVKLTAGSGIIVTGNRITTSGATAVDYGVEFQSTSESGVVCGNYFSGFASAAVRIANGANNISCYSNELAGGITHVINQNPAGSRDSSEMTDGVLLTDSVRMDKFAFYDLGELTIAAGVVTILGSRHTIDTEGDAATDDLDTINGAAFDRQILVLSSASSGRDPTLKDATGNMNLAGDFTMVTGRDRIILEWDQTASTWYELSRSTN